MLQNEPFSVLHGVTRYQINAQPQLLRVLKTKKGHGSRRGLLVLDAKRPRLAPWPAHFERSLKQKRPRLAPWPAHFERFFVQMNLCK
jgi:hypothetical protein